MGFEQHTELQLMEALEVEPETSQADLAAQVGVAVGTVNWYMKRWSAKGFVKVKRIGRWRWRYLLTPQGIAEKGRLAGKYVEASMRIYRQTRQQASQILEEVSQLGYDSVIIDDEGDIADICVLTCLEYGIKYFSANESPSQALPTVRIVGMQIALELPEPMIEDEA